MELISPWQLQQAIDTSASGSLNYSGTSTIRECLRMNLPDPSVIEGQHAAHTEDRSRKRRKKFFTSNFLLRKEARKLEDHAKSLGSTFKLNDALTLFDEDHITLAMLLSMIHSLFHMSYR